VCSPLWSSLFLAQCPTDTLRGAALDLAFDVARVDRLPDILERRVALDCDVAHLHVHADVAEMRAESRAGALCIQRYFRIDRAAGARGLQRNGTQFKRIEFTGIGAGRERLAVAPLDRLDRDFPEQVAVRWVLEQPQVASAIVGARTTEQFKDTLAAAGWRLPEESRERLEQVSAPAQRYPRAMEATMAARRDQAVHMPRPP
jgi:aryl-alcohol dehydrogenase-like predicted oxidoreductase